MSFLFQWELTHDIIINSVRELLTVFDGENSKSTTKKQYDIIIIQNVNKFGLIIIDKGLQRDKLKDHKCWQKKKEQ